MQKLEDHPPQRDAARLAAIEHEPIGTTVDGEREVALRKHPDNPDVPLALDFMKDPSDRKVMELIISRQEIAFPDAAPPGVPADRLAALRKGFADTLRDQAFVQEAEKMGLEVSPVSGDEVLKILTAAYATAPELVERARQAVTQRN